MKRRVVWLAASLLGFASCGEEESPHLHGMQIQEIRPNEWERNPMWAYGPDDVLEFFDSPSGAFRIHFTRNGIHGVPPSDKNGDGIPDFVEEVAASYDEVHELFESMGYRMPRSDDQLAGENGGDERFDVYLLDFGMSSDGSFVADQCDPSGCIGHVVQENDFQGYNYPSTRVANRILASHEYFHAIQAAYGFDAGVILSEGTAVWATEYFDPNLDDFERLIAGYLNEPERSLDLPPPGPVPPFAYGSAIFFRFLEERFDAEVIRLLLEEVAELPWLTALDEVLSESYGSSFASAFEEFAWWNLHTARAADPEIAYREGSAYPPVRLEPQELPARIERPRIYYASTRYYEVQPGERSRIVAELVSSEPKALEGLRIFGVARKEGAKVAGIQGIDPAEGRLELAVGEADSLVIGIVNRAMSGESRRPIICIGSEEEVASCKSASPSPPPEAEEGPEKDAKEKGGGGCGVAADESSAWTAWPLGFALIALIGRRRRAA